MDGARLSAQVEQGTYTSIRGGLSRRKFLHHVPKTPVWRAKAGGCLRGREAHLTVTAIANRSLPKFRRSLGSQLAHLALANSHRQKRSQHPAGLEDHRIRTECPELSVGLLDTPARTRTADTTCPDACTRLRPLHVAARSIPFFCASRRDSA